MSFTEFLIQNQKDIVSSLIRHIQLVGVAVAIGMVVAIPLGIFLTRHKKAANAVLAFVGMIQTIPGLVMLGFALIFLGIGILPALVVLGIYAILPILRNTFTGITEVEPSYIEAAKGIGMTKAQILYKVELPLAMPSVIGGIRISTVYTVSWATLAGLIGAGGLGDLIWTGLSTYNTNFILAGAVPSAIIAVLFSGLISVVQRGLTPRGLKGVRI
ncbi:ABC transporter permease [Sinanaerobacter chloroacetimidivorans]|jgi:osmoprotectant transport system permease protein|uniref:ABC transporter permease n=1 Tax=Sinanaerobacter chloroacetimidivorans TaxID=2818044 RepID=A0A8J7W0A0_9FIRM|nr:ABC transporter permease [Sinanaerobacter chloroacetimidivorans]MBR0597996.1 ABC transporter permease [Sinanaerobacter chloroacetimidivorans]